MAASTRSALGRVALFALVTPATALAAAPEGLSQVELERREGMLARYASLVDPTYGDFAPAEHDHGPTCLTGLVKDLRESPHLFDDGEWLDLTSTLGLPLAMSSQGAPDAPPAPDGTCVGNTGANSLAGDHFVVYWDGATETQAQSLLDALEESWDVLIDDLGWKPPVGTPGLKLRFQIADSNYAGAYTTIDYCSGVGYVPYMVTGRGSFNAGTWYKTMAAHEFNHASQWGYGYAHEFYWWEATATWVEEYVYPTYNDWAQNYVYYSFYPHISLNASDQNDQEIFGHMYAMGIWATYLDEYVGGHDFVMGTWEEAQGENGQYDYWMPDVLDDMGEDFDTHWQGFMAATAFMDFEEYSAYYEIQETERAGSLPADGDEPRDAAWSLGVNYVEFDEDEGGDGMFLQVDFAGDDSVDWNVVLVTGGGHTVEEYVPFDIDDGQGSAWIPFEGDVTGFLVISPKDDDASGYYYDWSDADEYEYEWSACLVGSETGVPCGFQVEDSGDTKADDDPDSPDGEKGGCGCAAPVAPMTGLVWAFGLVGLAARRRRI